MIAKIIVQLTRFLCGANVRWLGCEPRDHQRIYFANHTSHLDFLVIWSALPISLRNKTRPVAARDYWLAKPWRRYLAEHVFHAVLIERHKIPAPDSPDNPLNIMLAALKKKFSLILFPEGSRNVEEEMQSFKSGLYHLAKAVPGVELIPVYLENLSRILPKGEFLPVPLIGSITFGPAMALGSQETKADFLNRCRHAIKSLEDL